MATYYWVAASANNFNSLNWSLSDGGAPTANVPGASDTAVFKNSSSSQDCTVTANVSLTSLDMRNDYAGTYQGGGYTHTITGTCSLGCSASGTIMLGSSGTWNVGGTFRSDLVLGTWDPQSSVVKLTGTSANLSVGDSCFFYDLEINGTITANNSNIVYWHHDLTIKANKTLTLSSNRLQNFNLGATRQSKLYLESGADLNCGGYGIRWYTPGSGGVASQADSARLRNGYIYALYPSVTDGVGVWDFGATYGWEDMILRVYNPGGSDGSFTFPNKVCKIGGYVSFELRVDYPNGSLTIYPGGNDCDVRIGNGGSDSTFYTYSEDTTTGDLTIDNSGVVGNYWRVTRGRFDSHWFGSGDYTWTKNEEILYFDGTTNQEINTANMTGDFYFVQVNKTSGYMYLSSNLDVDIFDTLGSGGFDLNEYDLDVSSHFTVRGSSTWIQSNGSTITLSGSASANVQAENAVDDVVLNRSAGTTTQIGNFKAKTLTLTDGVWTDAGYDVTLSDDGIDKGPDILYMAGTWSLGGDTNIADSLNVASTTELIFTANALFEYHTGRNFKSLTINSGVTVTVGDAAGTYIYINDFLDIYGTFDFSATANGYHVITCTNNASAYLRSGGTLVSDTGEGIYFRYTTSGNGILLNEGTWEPAQTRFDKCDSGTRFAPGTYGGILMLWLGTGTDDVYITPDSGNFVIDCDLEIYHNGTGKCYVDMSNNPTIQFTGYLAYNGGASPTNVDWTVSDETLELTGSANQYYEWGHEVGNIVINNSGTGSNLFMRLLNSDAHLHCKSLTGLDGGLQTNGYPVTVEGDVILDLDNVTATNEDWNIYGHFDWKDVTTWSVASGTTFIMHGSSKYLLGSSSKHLTNLTIASGASVYTHTSTDGGVIVVNSTCQNYGTLTVSDANFGIAGGDLILEDGAILTGTAILIMYNMVDNHGIQFATGSYTWSVASTICYDPEADSLIPAANYGSGVFRIWADASSSTWEPETGTYTFGTLWLSCENTYTFNIDNRTNQPAFVITDLTINPPSSSGALNIYNNHASLDIDYDIYGDVEADHYSTLNWYKGSGTLTFLGTSNGTFDLYDSAVEDIIVSKTSPSGLFLGYDADCESLTFEDGLLDFNDYDIDIAGDFICTSNSDTIYMGIGSTITVDGNVDISGVTTFGLETGKLVLTGTGKTITGRGFASDSPYSVEIANGATITIVTTHLLVCNGPLTINGTLTCTGGYLIPNEECQVSIGSSGYVTGSSYVYFLRCRNGGGLVDYQGLIDTPRIYIRDMYADAADWPAGIYDSSLWVYAHTLGNYITFEAGTHTWTGNLLLNSAVNADGYIYCNTYDPDIEIGLSFFSSTANGHVTNWYKGNGTITFNGTDPTIDATAIVGTLDAIDISISGTATLDYDLDCQSLYINTGTFDANDFDVTINDFFRMESGSYMLAGNGVWDAGGDWDTVNVTTDNIDYETGEIRLTGTGDIEVYSNASVNNFNKLTIYGTYTMPETSDDLSINGTNGWLKIKDGGTFTVVDTSDAIYVRLADDLIIESGGELVIGANAQVVILIPSSGHGVTNDGTISGSGLLSLTNWQTDNVISAGNYGCNVECRSHVTGGYTFSSGTYNFGGNLIFQAVVGSVTTILDIGTNNPVINIDGQFNTYGISTTSTTVERTGASNDLTIGSNFRFTGAGSHTYNKGTGDIIMNGSGDVILETGNSLALEDLIINKNSSVTLYDDLNAESLTISSGGFDANDFDVLINPGDWILSSNDDLLMGSGSWTVWGNLDFTGYLKDNGFDSEASSILLKGTSKEIDLGGQIAWSNRPKLLDITIDGSYTVHNDNTVEYHTGLGDLIINGTFEIPTGNDWHQYSSAGISSNFEDNVDINPSGTLSGNGAFYIHRPANGGGLTTFASANTTLTIDIFGLLDPFSGAVFSAEDYSTVNQVEISTTNDYGANGVFEWGSGDYTFSNLTMNNTQDSHQFTIDGRVNGPSSLTIKDKFLMNVEGDNSEILWYANHATQDLDYDFQGDVEVAADGSSSTIDWYPGSGAITFTSNNNQEVSFTGTANSIEAVTINKNGGQIAIYDDTGPGEGLHTANFLASDGILDFQYSPTIETDGDFTINSANGSDVSVSSNDMDGTNITVGNDFYVSNVTFSANDTWYLDVQGSSALAFDVSVRYSDANAGTTIDATAPGNTDLGVNYNWDFGALPDEAACSIQSLSIHCFPWTRMTNRYVRGNRRR